MMFHVCERSGEFHRVVEIFDDALVRYINCSSVGFQSGLHPALSSLPASAGTTLRMNECLRSLEASQSIWCSSNLCCTRHSADPSPYMRSCRSRRNAKHRSRSSDLVRHLTLHFICLLHVTLLFGLSSGYPTSIWHNDAQ